MDELDKSERKGTGIFSVSSQDSSTEHDRLCANSKTKGRHVDLTPQKNEVKRSLMKASPFP